MSAEPWTLGRLLIAPMSRAGLIVGKTVPFFLMSLGQTVLLFLAGKVLFQIERIEIPAWLDQQDSRIRHCRRAEIKILNPVGAELIDRPAPCNFVQSCHAQSHFQRNLHEKSD